MPIITTYTRQANGQMASQGYSAPMHNLRSTRQKVPYVTGPYRSTRQNHTARHPPYNGVPSFGAYITNDDSSYGLYHEAKTLQLARRRLNRSLINGRAALGITAATANQTLSMVATRGSQLLNAYKALKKGNVRKFEKSLGILRNSDGTINHGNLKFTKRKLPPRVRNHFNRQVQLASKRKRFKIKKGDIESTWLEYTFGWVPLIADVHEVAKVMSDPFEVKRSYGTAKIQDIQEEYSWQTKITTQGLFQTRTVCTAGLKITNPNVALLTQLGLNNPLAVAWDIIPFSFVVDWFFKISTYLNTWNDMAGFAHVDPVTTVTKRVQGLLTTGEGRTTTAAGYKRERSIGIVNKPVTPHFQLPSPSLWLAATSWSLLAQKFRK